mmetsp:Transcript_20523/g.52060  ORF Transcript_20523/g.52060 Transcript_20523/m.52060 type:complete len:356 (+) Transcript_20523:773-1840(+)
MPCPCVPAPCQCGHGGYWCRDSGGCSHHEHRCRLLRQSRPYSRGTACAQCAAGHLPAAPHQQPGSAPSALRPHGTVRVGSTWGPEATWKLSWTSEARSRLCLSTPAQPAAAPKHPAPPPAAACRPQWGRRQGPPGCSGAGCAPAAAGERRALALRRWCGCAWCCWCGLRCCCGACWSRRDGVACDGRCCCSPPCCCPCSHAAAAASLLPQHPCQHPCACCGLQPLQPCCCCCCWHTPSHPCPSSCCPASWHRKRAAAHLRHQSRCLPHQQQLRCSHQWPLHLVLPLTCPPDCHSRWHWQLLAVPWQHSWAVGCEQLQLPRASGHERGPQQEPSLQPYWLPGSHCSGAASSAADAS